MSNFPIQTLDSIISNNFNSNNNNNDNDNEEGPLNKNESLNEFINNGIKITKLNCKNQSIDLYKYIVYILKCVDGKYYVGITKQLNFLERLKSHFLGTGSSWTQKYKPIQVIESYYENDKFQEHLWFLKTCDKYGIENVRGASYVNILMSKLEILCITKEINNALDKCFICRNEGHYSKECPNKIFELNDRKRKRKNTETIEKVYTNVPSFKINKKE
jgi:predicted GIY-YIG superfamily endonuclease